MITISRERVALACTAGRALAALAPSSPAATLQRGGRLIAIEPTKGCRGH